MPPTGLSREDARAVAAYLASLRLPDLRAARPAAPAPDPSPGAQQDTVPAVPAGER
jgi:hypothetical protein